jgi:iron complex transport system substrate-binding protein
MKRLLITALCLLLLSGCGAIDYFSGLLGGGDNSTDLNTQPAEQSTQEPQPFPITVDGVQFERAPERIVSLSPALSEILFELGQGDRLIGKSDYCDYPRDLRDVTAIASPIIDLDIGAIISLSADLLLLSSPISEKDRRTLEQEGVATIVIPSPKSLDEFRNVYRVTGLILYGAFTGADEGDTAFSPITLACNNPDVIDLGSFVYITENMSIATGDTLESSVFSCFGSNLAKDAVGYVFDKSELLENQPDLILLNSSISLKDLQGDEVFSQLEAVKQERVISLDNIYFERPSGRLVSLISEMQVKYKDMKAIEAE